MLDSASPYAAHRPPPAWSGPGRFDADGRQGVAQGPLETVTDHGEAPAASGGSLGCPRLEQPVHAVDEIEGFEGLGDVVVCAGVHARADIGVLRLRGKQEDR